MNTLNFFGTIKGIDSYNKIIIIVDNPDIITNKVNDVINPYKLVNNKLECYIKSYKLHYIEYVRENIDKQVNVKIIAKQYSFNGKKGTSFILKSLEII